MPPIRIGNPAKIEFLNTPTPSLLVSQRGQQWCPDDRPHG